LQTATGVESLEKIEKMEKSEHLLVSPIFSWKAAVLAENSDFSIFFFSQFYSLWESADMCQVAVAPFFPI
jgi:hypothetical protein